jgi:hypothetical protein
MAFQHGGHACAGGIAGVLGAFGINLPEHHGSTLQERVNNHHERVTQHVQEHRDNVREHVDNFRDNVQNHFGGGGGMSPGGAPDPGESAWMMGNQPLNLIFGDPVAAEAHQYSLAAIPVGGGVTMSIVALIMVIALTLIMASMLIRTVVVKTVTARCS